LTTLKQGQQNCESLRSEDNQDTRKNLDKEKDQNCQVKRYNKRWTSKSKLENSNIYLHHHLSHWTNKIIEYKKVYQNKIK